ncbi:hypothetical protein [Nitrosomonas sp. Nm132]|uniref:hypothetical protein n=1 Tax=Nitrosomonas sp. Nm132 TaxID=1881053 RepID=UPI00088B32D4|nr:hypothetical protein [Nitrosomonas sp. Nm132]SDH25195.1 hypothetical protein SAMN05428952_10094 [Nitrosomonas sp. Nm132]
MKARPIIFSSQMVRALLENRKTQTRRIVNPQPELSKEGNLMGDWLKKPLAGLLLPKLQDITIHCPFGKIGDRLWVRETFQIISGKYYYAATPPNPYDISDIRWKPSILMPRLVSRINLEMVSVGVERLQDISVEDAIAEGVPGESEAAEWGCTSYEKPRKAYWRIWEQINGKGSWNEDPYVWKIEFRRI